MKLRKKSSEKVFKRLAIFGVEGTVAPVPSVLGGLLVDLVRADQVPGIVNLLMTCQSKQLFPIRDHTLLPTFLLGLSIVEGTTTAYIAKANPSDLYQLVNFSCICFTWIDVSWFNVSGIIATWIDPS